MVRIPCRQPQRALVIRRFVAPVLAGVAGLALAAIILVSGSELEPQPPTPNIPGLLRCTDGQLPQP